MPEFRKDPVIDRWVIIAAERSKRPQPARIAGNVNHAEACPFCRGNESMTPPEICVYRGPTTRADPSAWQIRVVPNKYPAVIGEGDLSHQREGLCESMTGIGAHEVIIESPEHCVDMAELDEEVIENVLQACRDRMVHLREDKRWQHVLIYKNQGGAAGATLEHVHSQLIALPMVPREVGDEVRAAEHYHRKTQHCIYCDIIDEQRREGRRLVSENGDFVVCCPFAPRFPFETWILPKKHAAFFDRLSDIELVPLARALRETLRRLHSSLDQAPFNYVIHSAPFHKPSSEHYHWHIEIMPRTTGIAGFEWGSGYYINTVAPEDAAQVLREAKT